MYVIRFADINRMSDGMPCQIYVPYVYTVYIYISRSDVRNYDKIMSRWGLLEVDNFQPRKETCQIHSNSGSGILFFVPVVFFLAAAPFLLSPTVLPPKAPRFCGASLVSLLRCVVLLSLRSSSFRCRSFVSAL